jgi:drug/metabolite transporter (DMT)-like permease
MEGEGRGSGGALPFGAFAACSAIWGSTFLVISIGNDTVPPVWAASLRLAAAALILIAIAFLTGKGLPRGAAFRAAALYGLFGFGVNFPLLYRAEQVVPSGLAAVIYATIPLSTAFLAPAFGLERLRSIKVGGALVGLAGVAVIFATRLGGGFGVLALLALVAGATFAALGNLMLKRGPRQPAIGANAVAAGVGFLVTLPISFLLGEAHPVPAAFDEWFPIAYLTLAGSVGAYVMLVWLLNRWTATATSFITLVIPVVAVTLGALVRDEPVTLLTVLGTVLVLGGVSLGIAADRWSAKTAGQRAPQGVDARTEASRMV